MCVYVRVCVCVCVCVCEGLHVDSDIGDCIYGVCCHWHTATHCNRVQQSATHFNALQYATAHCNTLQHIQVAACIKYDVISLK